MRSEVGVGSVFTVRLRFGYAHLPPEQVNNESLPVAQSVYVADPYSSVYAPLIVYQIHATRLVVRRQSGAKSPEHRCQIVKAERHGRCSGAGRGRQRRHGVCRSFMHSTCDRTSLLRSEGTSHAY